MTTQELFLKTIFCCMACDGDIAKEEVAMVKDTASSTDMFGSLNVEDTINEYIKGINANGVKFLNAYLNELSEATLNDEEQLSIIDLSIQTIMADDKIEYSEVKFFKKIRSRLSISDESIIGKYPDIEDWLLPDINVADEPVWNDVMFENISFTTIK